MIVREVDEEIDARRASRPTRACTRRHCRSGPWRATSGSSTCSPARSSRQATSPRLAFREACRVECQASSQLFARTPPRPPQSATPHHPLDKCRKAHRKMRKISSISESPARDSASEQMRRGPDRAGSKGAPGKSGWRMISSAKMHPTDHMSTPVE